MSAAGVRVLWRPIRSESAFGLCFLLAIGLTVFEIDFPQSLAGAGLAAIALIIARTDWRSRIIPNVANLSAALLAVVNAVMHEEPFAAATESLARGATVFLVFLGFRSAFHYWRRREGMGLGDVKLAGVLGLWLDWYYIPIAVEMACLSAIIYVFVCKYFYGQRVEPLAKLPFGAFLAPSIWVAWMLETIRI